MTPTDPQGAGRGPHHAMAEGLVNALNANRPQGAGETRTPSEDAVGVAREEVLHRVNACELSVGESGTIAEYSRDRKKLEASLDALIRAVRAECAAQVEALREELDVNAKILARREQECITLRAKAEIVDAMERGEIAAFSYRKDGRVALYTERCLREYEDEPIVAPTLVEAYAQARAAQGGTDAE